MKLFSNSYKQWFKELTFSEQVRVVYLGVSLMGLLFAACTNSFWTIAIAIANLYAAYEISKDIELPESTEDDYKF